MDGLYNKSALNMLIWGIGNNHSRDIFTKLLQKVSKLRPLGNIVVLYSGEEEKQPLDDTIGLSCSAIVTGGWPNYSGFSFYNKLLPVDSRLLEEMAPYENEIFKMMDRLNLRSYEERWRLYIEHLRFWNTALDYWGIKIYIHQLIPHEITDYIIYALCKIKGIPFIGTSYSFFQGYSFMITDIYKQFELLKGEVARVQKSMLEPIILRKDAELFYNKYVEKCNRDIRFDLKAAMADFREKSKKRKHFSIMKARAKWLFSCAKRLCSFDISVFSWRRQIDNSMIFRENTILENYYEANAVLPRVDLPYIYVPLNAQPELSTSPCGGKYADLLLWIEMLSYYLPEGWWLYVKEHPLMKVNNQVYSNSRSDIFYDKLLHLDNVKLISMNEDTFNLIENARAVAVVTGSAGMEALFRRKSVLVCGKVFLEAAPQIYYINNNIECMKAMEELGNGKGKVATERDLKLFFEAMFSCSIHGSMDLPFLDPNQNRNDVVKAMVDGYYETIRRML